MTEKIEVKELSEDEYDTFRPRISDFQTRFTFPINHQHFYFDNGDDYFSWFRTMGQLHYFVALDGEEVVAVAAQITRQLVNSAGEKTEPFWYLCDLKVHPDYRGLGIPEKIFTNRFPHHYFRCPRGYAVTIDPIDQSENAIVRMLQNFPMIPFSVATKLGVIMLDTELMEEVDPILRRHRGPISYSSAAGIRDIVPNPAENHYPFYTRNLDRVHNQDTKTRSMLIRICFAHRWRTLSLRTWRFEGFVR